MLSWLEFWKMLTWSEKIAIWAPLILPVLLLFLFLWIVT